MKKFLLVLGIITCMAALTACGKQNQEEVNLITTAEAEKLASDWVDNISNVVQQKIESDFVAYAQQNGWDASVFENAFESWRTASEDMGDYSGIIEITENSMVGEEHNGVNYPVEGEIIFRIQGSRHNAEVVLVYENYMPTSISTNVEYTFAENIEKAALNTLLGMGTVFSVLVLISLIISAFSLISKVQGSEKKAGEPQEKKVDNVVAQIIEKEELSDDLELVAVISAAIAAYEGSGSTDGFVVRSIRKAHR